MTSTGNPTQFRLTLSVALVLGGCLTEARVLTMEDGGADDMQTGSEPGGNQMGMQIMQPSAGTSGETDSMGIDSMGMGMIDSMGMDVDMGMEPGMQMQLPSASEGSSLPDRAACADEATLLLGDLDEVYDLAVTESALYVATLDGVLRSARTGGMSERVVDQYVPRILADEQSLYWSSGSLDLNVRGEDGQSEVFLPTHGAIEGVSQDTDAVYAISDGYLVRVDKATREVLPLVEGTSSLALHWSGTAVDAEHVYFVSYPSQGQPALERVRKDGSGREALAMDITNAMAPVKLLVDDSHVYIGGFGDVTRVAVEGGMLEPLTMFLLPSSPELPLAQDDECIYYAADRALICVRKADASSELVYAVSEGSIRALAVHGSEIYFGVYVDGPAFEPAGWVGRIECQP